MKLCPFILLLLSSINLFSQDASWVITGISDTVLGICEQGEKIWVATENNGIQYFDKSTGAIEIFNVENGSLPTNKFHCINIINDKIYAGSYDNGYFIKENNNWIRIDSSNSEFPSNNVIDILFDDVDSSIWLATDKGLVNEKNGNYLIFDSLNSGLAGNKLTSLFMDDFNTLWIGTFFAGLSKYKDGEFTTFNYDNAGINDNWVRTVEQDTSYILYVADYLGVDKYDPVGDVWLFVFNTTTSGLTSNQVNHMLVDSDHNIWFCTHSGITKWDFADSWIQFTIDNSPLPHNTSDYIIQDQDGIVWIGTFGGLAGYKTREFSFPDFGNDLTIYPNPASTEIQIESINGEKIQIADALGKIVFELEFEKQKTGEMTNSADVSNLRPGIYFVILISNENLVIKPLVIK